MNTPQPRTGRVMGLIRKLADRLLPELGAAEESARCSGEDTMRMTQEIHLKVEPEPEPELAENGKD